MTNPYVAQMRQWRQTLTKDQRWAILIAADPDALASALALKRIMAHRVRGVDIFRINEVTRPDNLAMIRYLRIPAKLWQPEKADLYTNFAMVDSQPHHNPAFQGIPFDQRDLFFFPRTLKVVSRNRDSFFIVFYCCNTASFRKIFTH